MLSAIERQQYDAFVAHHGLAVFYNSWYLDAVCGTQKWSCVFAYDKDESLAAIWPFFLRKRLGGIISTLDKPPFTLFLGPWVASPKTPMNSARALSRYHRLLQQLERQLPNLLLRRAYLPYDQYNTLPLAQMGWTTRLFQSYQLPTHLKSAGEICQRFDPKLRHDLKLYPKIKERIELVENTEDIITLNDNFSGYQSSNAKVLSSVLKKLLAASARHNSAIGWLFSNETGTPIAAIWLPFDRSNAYLVIAASNPRERSQEKAISQLIWHAIQWACERKLIFDFEGSSLVGVEAFYRSWGPEPRKYVSVVKKTWNWLPG